MRRR
ncbi:hypothetical protein LINPERHAP1_LOCUS8566 [Linum perenne]|jgi:hypothetical protein